MNERVYIQRKSSPGRASISRERPGRKVEKKRIKVLGRVEESAPAFRVYFRFSCIAPQLERYVHTCVCACVCVCVFSRVNTHV